MNNIPSIDETAHVSETSGGDIICATWTIGIIDKPWILETGKLDLRGIQANISAHEHIHPLPSKPVDAADINASESSIIRMPKSGIPITLFGLLTIQITPNLGSAQSGDIGFGAKWRRA